MTVDATLNWWGDPSGPRPLGTGDYAYEESTPSECPGCHRDPVTWVRMRDWTGGSATYNAPTNLVVSPWLAYDPAPPEAGGLASVRDHRRVPGVLDFATLEIRYVAGATQAHWVKAGLEALRGERWEIVVEAGSE